MWKRWQSLTLWLRVLIAMGLGVAVGLALGKDAAVLKPIGDLFIALIRMLVVPLIFASLIAGMTSFGEMAGMARVAVKTVLLFAFTAVAAVCIGLVMANLIGPGIGVQMSGLTPPAPPKAQGLAGYVIGMVPTNPFAALAQGDTLQVIVFAILLGVAINLVGEAALPVKRFFDAFAEIMFKLTHLVMEVAPFGVFGLMAWVAGTYGLEILLPLGKIILTLYLACILQLVFVYGGVVALIGRLNPVRFYRGIADALMVGFSTCTSAGTFPVTMANVQDNLGVPRNIASFVLSTGTTVNMDGTAIYLGIAAVFTAQAFGIDLTMGQYLTIILTATLAAVGTAPVPGASLIMMSVVLTSVGLPLEIVALVAGVDRVMDMMRTLTNVAGDATAAAVVSRTEGVLDLQRFNAKPVE
jgi:Na+/H+-dicarboxylate symporter